MEKEYPNTPKSYEVTHHRYSKVFSSTLHIKLTLYLHYRYLGIRTICGNWIQIPPIMSRNIRSNSEFSASHSTFNEILLKCQCNLGVELYFFRVFRVLGQFREIRPQCLIFLKLSSFIILTNRALNFLSRMGSINSFGQTVQEILLNNYLKSNFQNSEIRDFVATFWNFIRQKFS